MLIEEGDLTLRLSRKEAVMLGWAIDDWLFYLKDDTREGNEEAVILVENLLRYLPEE